MTPKEKAKELVWKYYHQIEHTMSNEYSDKCWELSKQCTLIAVDEIILFFNNGAFKLTYPEITKYEIPYWMEVKQEIEKL